jgi:HEPN domain-containing protein
MKQTAIEWLVYVVQSNIAPNYIPKEIVEQAKEMEKQQIIDAWVDGNDNEPKEVTEDFAEQYYNETFNK